MSEFWNWLKPFTEIGLVTSAGAKRKEIPDLRRLAQGTDTFRDCLQIMEVVEGLGAGGKISRAFWVTVRIYEEQMGKGC